MESSDKPKCALGWYSEAKGGPNGPPKLKQPTFQFFFIPGPLRTHRPDIWTILSMTTCRLCYDRMLNMGGRLTWAQWPSLLCARSISKFSMPYPCPLKYNTLQASAMYKLIDQERFPSYFQNVSKFCSSWA